MGAPGEVEPPTNGLGNWGFHSSLNRISHLQVGLAELKRERSGQSAVIWQRIWQREFYMIEVPEKAVGPNIRSLLKIFKFMGRRSSPPISVGAWCEGE